MGAATYNARNQRDGQSHDAAGNMTSDGYTTFAYDATGRETSASSGVSHTYDGDLMRVKRVENGVTTLYLRSSILGGAIIAEMNAAGGWTRGYVYGESGGLTAIQQPEGYVEWVTSDPVTKGQRITNSQGLVTAALEFDPFGGETSKSYNSYRQPQKYTTYTRDGNGTDDAMHRRYSGFWSRFQQPDPYDGSYNLADPQSFNRYAYVQNDPVNFVDPSGLNMQAPGTCMIDGMQVSCGEAYGALAAGVGIIGPANTTRFNPNANNGQSGWEHFYVRGNEAGWLGTQRAVTGICFDGGGCSYATTTYFDVVQRLGSPTMTWDGRFGFEYDRIIRDHTGKIIGELPNANTDIFNPLDFINPGSIGKGIIVGSVKNVVRTGLKGLIKDAGLPTRGMVRFIPPANSINTGLRQAPGGGFIDKFGNIWARPKGQIVGERHWDVQLSSTGRVHFGWASRSGSHINVSSDGRIVH